MMPIIRFVCCGKETFTLQLQKSYPASHQEDVYTVTHEKARSYADAMPHATFIQKADTISPIFSHFYKTCKYFPSQTCMHKRKKRIKCEVKYTFSFHLITSIFKSKVAWRFFFHCREKKCQRKLLRAFASAIMSNSLLLCICRRKSLTGILYYTVTLYYSMQEYFFFSW